MRATVTESMFLDRWLLGFGDAVRDVVKERLPTPELHPAGRDHPGERKRAR